MPNTRKDTQNTHRSPRQPTTSAARKIEVNAIVLWNTRYQNAALDQLRRDGHDVRDDELRRLSPLGHDHLNLLGRYQFSAPDLPDGQLRALRDPAT